MTQVKGNKPLLTHALAEMSVAPLLYCHYGHCDHYITAIVTITDLTVSTAVTITAAVTAIEPFH